MWVVVLNEMMVSTSPVVLKVLLVQVPDIVTELEPVKLVRRFLFTVAFVETAAALELLEVVLPQPQPKKTTRLTKEVTKNRATVLFLFSMTAPFDNYETRGAHFPPHSKRSQYKKSPKKGPKKENLWNV